MKIYVITGRALLLLLYYYNGNSNTIEGTYVSKTPNLADKIQIMYVKGYYNFVYTKPGDTKLELNMDNI